jgi:RNA polymerase sigma factor (sigma-70 family)
MNSDADLLQLFAQTRSQEAFAELVHRYLGLVYAAALRQLAGDTHRAKDVSQMVFTDLALKAPRLVQHPALAAWLYRSTRYAVAGVVRAENRRKNREKEADAMREIHEAQEPAVEWDRVGPVIDEVICALSEREREVICLRFFSGRSFSEIGAHYLITADAARFRVDRALAKMREHLGRRGVNSTAVALALALETQACAGAPAGMAAAIAGVAAGAVGSGGISPLQLMTTSKKIGVAAALIAAAGVMITLELSRQRILRHEIAGLTQATAPLPALRAVNKRLQAEQKSLLASRVAAGLAPSSLPANSARADGGPAGNSGSRLTREQVALLDQQPVPLDVGAPVYPTALVGSGVSGAVQVEFVVGADGSVTSAYAMPPGSRSPGEVVVMTPGFASKSSPPLSADISDADSHAVQLAAMKAASQWVFRPGRRNGQAVNTRVEMVVQVRPPAPFIPPTQ